MVKLAALAPLEVGAAATARVQFVPAARTGARLAQALLPPGVTVNWVGSVPVRVVAVMVTGDAPVFCRRICFDAPVVPAATFPYSVVAA